MTEESLMPYLHPQAKHVTKSVKKAEKKGQMHAQFDAKLAGIALVEGLIYLKKRLGWSGTKIAETLHLPANTLNTWLKNGSIPLSNAILQPDIQAIVHLLAIHRSLEAMFSEAQHQSIWLATYHQEINQIPEKMMADSIEGLIFIRQYLDYVRGRGA